MGRYLLRLSSSVVGSMSSSVFMETGVVSPLNSCARGGLAGNGLSGLAFVVVVEVVVGVVTAAAA
jgi:hypothetical protein